MTAIDAVQWNGQGSEKEVSEFLGSKTQQLENENYVVKLENGTCVLGSLYIKTLEGEVKAEIGDWIIKEHGKFYPLDPETFKEIFEQVDISDELLKEASKLVGHPATNLSGSVDVACMEWHKKYESFIEK